MGRAKAPPTPSGKRVRVDRIFGDSEGDSSFTCYEEEFTEAARAARTSAGGWERDGGRKLP